MQFIPTPFPNTGVKIFITLCMIFWLGSAILLSLTDNHTIFQWINTRHTPFQDMLMPRVTRLGEIILIAAAGIILSSLPRVRQTKYFFLTFIFCNAIPALVNVIMKNIYARHRPLHYFQHEYWLHFLDSQPQQYHLSFPSGHTEGVFALMTLVCLILPRKRAWLSVILFAAALLTAYSRIYLVQHFFSDILAGSMVGTIFCLLTYSAIQNIVLRRREKLDKLN